MLKPINTFVRVIALVIPVMLFSAPSLAQDCPNAYREIPLERIEQMFDQMKTKAKWDTTAPLVWGYFFFDPERDKLAQVAGELKLSGYKQVELFKGGPMFTLHVEKIEAHTPASLFNRNAELGQLAKARCIKTYDGYDVGPVR